jgi:metallo-beta-lactamase class B
VKALHECRMSQNRVAKCRIWQSRDHGNLGGRHDLSSAEYHFVSTSGHPVSYPGIVQDFQHTFSVLRALPCDVFLGAHGGYFDMLIKLKRYSQDGPHVFIDPDGYKEFVADAQETFEKALSKQEAATAH